MSDPSPSPRVTHAGWARLVVQGFAPYKDAKVFPGGSREWDWRETGTHHRPGIQPADVEELLARGADTVVLSTGFQGRLQVCSQTLELLAARGVDVHVLRTEEAVRLYNELRQHTRVGALFHSTC